MNQKWNLYWACLIFSSISITQGANRLKELLKLLTSARKAEFLCLTLFSQFSSISSSLLTCSMKMALTFSCSSFLCLIWFSISKSLLSSDQMNFYQEAFMSRLIDQKMRVLSNLNVLLRKLIKIIKLVCQVIIQNLQFYNNSTQQSQNLNWQLPVNKIKIFKQLETVFFMNYTPIISTTQLLVRQYDQQPKNLSLNEIPMRKSLDNSSLVILQSKTQAIQQSRSTTVSTQQSILLQSRGKNTFLTQSIIYPPPNNEKSSISFTIRPSLQLKRSRPQNLIKIQQQLPKFDKQQKKKGSLSKIVTNLKSEIAQLKFFIKKEIREKVLEMHKLYNEGNKKSIELVMLIVRQLQRENQVLREKLTYFSKLEHHKISTTSLPKQVNSASKPKQIELSPVEKILEHENSLTEPESIQQNFLLKSELVKKVDEQSLLLEHSLPESNEFYQNAQSILLLNEHLATIHEIQNDDDDETVKDKINTAIKQMNTFSEKSYLFTDEKSLFVSSFHEDFNLVQNLQPLFKSENQPTVKSQHPQEHHKNTSEVNILPKSKANNPGESQKSKQKMHKKYISVLTHASNSQSQGSFLAKSFCEESNQKEKHLQEDSSMLPFTQIDLGVSEQQSSESICEALSILKQYNLNSSDCLPDKNTNEKQMIPSNFKSEDKKAVQKQGNQLKGSNKENAGEIKVKLKENKIKTLVSRQARHSPSNRMIYTKIQQFFPAHKPIMRTHHL